MNQKISSMRMTKEVLVLVINKERDIGTSYVLDLKNLHSLHRQTDATTYGLSERWIISLAQSNRTIKKTTQKFLLSAVLPLANRYFTDRVFTRKTLQVQWSCYTMNER